MAKKNAIGLAGKVGASSIAMTTGQTEISNSGVTPDKPTCKIKYASARIKLLRVDTSADDAAKNNTTQN